MLAEVPTGEKIDKLIGFWGFHPMLMLKRVGSTEAFRAFQGLLFLILTDSVVDVHSPHTKGRMGVLMGGSATERANSNNRQHKMGGITPTTSNHRKRQN
jgi:hypothetical protein